MLATDIPKFTAVGFGLFRDIPVDFMHWYEGESVPLHSHDFTELAVVLSGSAIHASPGGEYPIGAGDVFVVTGDQVHGYREASTLEIVNVLFRMNDLLAIRQQAENLPGYRALFTIEPATRRQDHFRSRLRLTPEQLDRMKDRLLEAVVERRRRLPGWELATLALFMLIISDLCRVYSEMENPKAQALIRLDRVIGYIHQHYAEPITADDLAAVGSMSRRTMTREFTKSLKVSPIDYLIRERVTRAADLLRRDGISVTDAAFRVGFRDSNYFSRKYRDVMGHRPRDARKQKPEE